MHRLRIASILLLFRILFARRPHPFRVSYAASLSIAAALHWPIPSLATTDIVNNAIERSEQIGDDDNFYGELEKYGSAPRSTFFGAPGNSPAEDVIGLVFKGLGTHRGKGMDDLKYPDEIQGSGAFTPCSSPACQKRVWISPQD
jgi:hypothetical protein